MAIANANIPHVSIEVKMGICIGKTYKLFYFTGDWGFS